MRLIRAIGELNAEGRPRIETVALYTDADATATFVRQADLTYHLGPAAARPYLDLAVLERAGHPRRHRSPGARRRLPADQPGGRARVRQRCDVPGAPGDRRPARRGPGDRRWPGRRVGAGRAGLLGAAPQPEDHRGVVLA